MLRECLESLKRKHWLQVEWNPSRCLRQLIQGPKNAIKMIIERTEKSPVLKLSIHFSLKMGLLTSFVNVFRPSLSLKLWGIIGLGYHIAKPAITTHKMAISSSNWPKSDRVAWKYAELAPTTMSKNQMTWMPEKWKSL